MVAENHYPAESELTDFHRSKIAELRKRAADDLRRYPEYDTDFSLLRWLMGWDYDIDVILPKMQKAIRMIVNLSLDEVHVKNEEEVNTYVKGQAPVVEYFPGGLMGSDKDGNIVYVQSLGKAHPKTLIKSGSHSGLYKWSIAETELTFKLVRKREKELGRKLGVKLITDLDGFGTDHLYTPTLKMFIGLLQIMQDMFPDFARKIIVINCPMMIQTAYALVSPTLSKQTREKVNFLGNDWREILAEEIGLEHIYPHWGGEKYHEIPTGGLRMGGKVPESIWYDSEKHPEDGDKADFKKLSIGARSREEIKLRGETGKTFKWVWRVSSGDIDFSIERHGEEVMAKMRLSTEFHPEIGELRCKKSGSYIFCFDNSHGKVFGKDVKYKIWLE